MGEYYLNEMEESKKEAANRIKRTKHDQVTQAVINYLQKRNYPITVPSEMQADEIKLEMCVDSEIGRPNSIMYSCYNSDPALIDHSYSKFIAWVKEVNKNKEYEDLSQIVAPLFCHLYLELIRRGHVEKASNFLRVYLPVVEKYKYDNNILKLINIINNETPDINGIKETFKSNKYVVVLRTKSVEILKRFLSDSCHTIMLQVFQTCFQLHEQHKEEHEVKDEDDKQRDMVNGHNTPTTLLQRLQEATAGVKKKMNLLFMVGINNLKDDVTCGLINREAGIAVYCYSSGVFIRSLFTLQQLKGTDQFNDVVLREHRDRVYDVSYISYSHKLVSASQDKTLRLFDLNDYTQKHMYRGHDHPVYSVSTSKNGDYIVSGSYDHTARLWSTEHGNTVRVYVGHTQEVTCVDFHLNDLYIVTGSADKNIRMWTVKDGNPVRLFLGSKGIIYSLAFSSNGKYLASAGDDKRLRIWDLIAGKQLCEAKVSAEPIVKIAWSSDDRLLCTGTLDGFIRTWESENLLKTTVEANLHIPKCTAMLNSKLLSIKYEYETFGCLTAKVNNSVCYNI